MVSSSVSVPSSVDPAVTGCVRPCVAIDLTTPSPDSVTETLPSRDTTLTTLCPGPELRGAASPAARLANRTATPTPAPKHRNAIMAGVRGGVPAAFCNFNGKKTVEKQKQVFGATIDHSVTGNAWVLHAVVETVVGWRV